MKGTIHTMGKRLRVIAIGVITNVPKLVQFLTGIISLYLALKKLLEGK